MATMIFRGSVAEQQRARDGAGRQSLAEVPLATHVMKRRAL
jgi:hypothetical protein